MPTTITTGAASAKGYGFAAQASGPAVYVEDVFSTYLYTGTGASQTITNGVDLSTKGGLVWIKSRSAATSNFLFDTVRGTTKEINSDTTDAGATLASSLTAFNTDGFTISSATGVGVNAATYTSWTFRKQAKFFTICSWTGDGNSPRSISHDLGSVPGCIIIKRTDAASDWIVWHRSLTGVTYNLLLNTTDAQANFSNIASSPTSSSFSVNGYFDVNNPGGTYVAYLFAHDAGGFGLSGTDSVIKCGSFTGNSAAAGQAIELGWEPQFVIIKGSSVASNWQIVDNMRGATVTSGGTYGLRADLSYAEYQDDLGYPYATGFVAGPSTNTNNNGSTYIYIAIRRGPMKTPTDATKVFQPKVYTGTNVNNRLVTTDIVTDMVMVRQRDDTVLGGMVVGDRLRGRPYLLTGATAVEVTSATAFDQEKISTTEYGTAFSSMTGFWIGSDATAKLNASTASNNQIAFAFKRAAGFFDCVCYTGTGSATTFSHNLGVVPDLMIARRRAVGASLWVVWHKDLPTLSGNENAYITLNSNAASAPAVVVWNGTAPTSSVFSVGTSLTVNTSSVPYVNYLFATCSGVSKVGSYTGTGTTKQIDCGFSGGARFVLIKRTDSTGDWYVWDTARGIIAANDPYLLLNSTAAEVTTTDYIDPYSAGFEISSTAPAAINASGGSYIYLAIA